MPLPRFRNRYIEQLPTNAYACQRPRSVAQPSWLFNNPPLANDLGIADDDLIGERGAAIWSGNALSDHTQPIALAYAGHQFGIPVPRLGDGRAILLGQRQHQTGDWYDLQLKGAGRTPFSRGGDGLAALGPVLREYIVSEAMHALGIPTTRALGALSTNERIARANGLEPGAILVRTARSHLRFGSFEYFAHLGDDAGIQTLADIAIDWHFPALATLPRAERYAALLRALVEQTARLISEWMRVGFIHGVMNTDNMAIAGETLDYGPCAFMDEFQVDQVFSAVDRGGRYAFNEQPGIGHWNLARLAECLLPLLDDDETKSIEIAERILAEYPQQFTQYYQHMLAAKLGLCDEDHPPTSEAIELAQTLLDYMQAKQTDFTLTFRQLGQAAPSDSAQRANIVEWFMGEDAMQNWMQAYAAQLAAANITEAQRQCRMNAMNPIFIPRNHQIQAAIAAASTGDLSVAERLIQTLKTPYADQPSASDLSLSPSFDERVTTTFCGT
ncbi:MAG: YdiU family protein [Spiribacter sp.]|jgi:uncharacterized protein YdiU (UPF0061 family)|nr:YdiU family protein [Spiribacter sp.]MDR9488952.1 YdiU family protein [Spiribacter sp.]